MSTREPLDLSYWADPEPIEFKYLDKVYSAPREMPSVLHARIFNWSFNLATMTEDAAERQAVELIAEAFSISQEEAAGIAKPARKTMLNFLASGRLPSQATTQ